MCSEGDSWIGEMDCYLLKRSLSSCVLVYGRVGPTPVQYVFGDPGIIRGRLGDRTPSRGVSQASIT